MTEDEVIILKESARSLEEDGDLLSKYLEFTFSFSLLNSWHHYFCMKYVYYNAANGRHKIYSKIWLFKKIKLFITSADILNSDVCDLFSKIFWFSWKKQDTISRRDIKKESIIDYFFFLQSTQRWRVLCESLVKICTKS